MKKIGTTIVFIMLMFVVKAQTITLKTLTRYVNTPLADITDELISKQGWELTTTQNLKKTVSLSFSQKNARLGIKRYKEFKNEVLLMCRKPDYDILNKSLLELKPTLKRSYTDQNGYLVKMYRSNKYIYQIEILPKSIFKISVFDKEDYVASDSDKLFESK